MTKTKTNLNKKEIKALKQECYCELARGDFWTFCKLMDPQFFKESRRYQKRLAHKLQNFYEDKEKKILLINMGPRFGKSYTMQMFETWILGVNPKERIMTASYNETLAIEFSKKVRNKIAEIKVDDDIIVYSDIFPETRITRGSAAAKLWAIDGQFATYLGTSPQGTATGFGCSLLVIDDLIKSSYEAHNAKTLEDHWSWFTGTMRSRVEQGGKIVIIATRWCNDDLSGRVLDQYEDVEVVKEPAVKNADAHKMLCDEILKWDDYKDILDGAADKNIIYANYNQVTFDEADKVYTHFKTYQPEELNGIWETYAYVDTADQGDDFLCSIIFGVDRGNRRVLVEDVYYTQEHMEVTEQELAKRLVDYKVNRVIIESNNGGRGFARSVKRIMEDDIGHYGTQVQTLTQTKNKQARIIDNCAPVMKFVYFPDKWHILYPEFWRDINRISRAGTALHDDSADALTGVYEISENMRIFR